MSIRKTQNSLKKIIGVIAVASLAGLAACSSTPSADSGSAKDVYEELNALEGDAAIERAREIAANEKGEVMFYTPINKDEVELFMKPFVDEYGIKVTIFQGNATNTLQRVVEEHEAGRDQADVVNNLFVAMSELEKMDLFTRYDGSQIGTLDERSLFDNWIELTRNIFVPSWNTDLVSDADAPRSWEELADPKYKGMITLELSDATWYAGVTKQWREEGKSDAEIDELWKKIADNSRVARGHTAIQEMVNAGQTAILSSQYSYIANRGIRAGAPVAFVPESGQTDLKAIATMTGVGLMNTSKVPASAWLLVDFLLSEEGQRGIMENGLVPTRDIPGDTGREGLTVIPMDVADWIENSKDWETKYDQLLRGVEVVE